MDICLINPPVNQHNAPLDIPLHLLVLATALNAAGERPYIIDFNLLTKCDPHYPLSNRFFDSALERISSCEPDLLGISCISSTTPFALEIARRYKREYPACKILLGGPQATLLHDRILQRYPFVDMVCRGEGECTLPEIISSWKDLEMVAGLSYRVSPEKVIINPDREVIKNLDQSPIPDYDLVDIEQYKAIFPAISLPIEAGRGCPYSCAYCSTSLVWRRIFRLKSVPRLVSEIVQTSKEAGIKSIHFIHDLFSLNKEWVFDLCKALASMDMGITWGCDTRVDAVNSELIKEMAKSGCKYIFFGLESGSKRILKQMGKDVDLNDSVTTIAQSLDQGIRTTVSFILGYPLETLEDLNETFNYIILLRILGTSGLVINTYMPEYGTETYHLCKDHLGLNIYMVKKDLPFAAEPILEMIEGDQEVFSHFYYFLGGHYDYHLLLRLMTVMPFFIVLPVFNDLHWLLPDKPVIEVFLELYPFIEGSLRFDEYQNVRYEVGKVYEGLTAYLSYLHETYKLQTDKWTVQRQSVKNFLLKLNGYE